MRRRFKLLAVLIGVPALLVALAAFFLPKLVDSDAYKRRLIALVAAQTGYALHMDGPVRLHLLPRLQVTVTDMRVSSPSGFEEKDLARLPWLAVDLELLPLLEGRIEAGVIHVRGLRINLERNRDGRGNWESMPTSSAERGANATPVIAAPLGAFTLGGLDVRDASLHWRDQARDQSIIITPIDVQTGPLRGGGRVDDVRLAATLLDGGAHLEARGDAALDASARTLTVPRLAIRFRDAGVAGMRAEGTADARLTADFDTQRVLLDALHGSSRLSGDDGQRLDVKFTTGLAVDMARARILASTVTLEVPAYSLAGARGALAFDGVLSGDLRTGIYTVDKLRGNGTVSGTAAGASGAAFALEGSLEVDASRQKLRAPGLTIAGSVDGDGLPFQLAADLDLSPPARTVTVSDMQLALGDWHLEGGLTLRALETLRGLQGVLDLRVRDQGLAGSFSATSAGDGGVDLGFDVVADLDLKGSGYTWKGRNAMVMRTTVEATNGLWRARDLRLRARLVDQSLRGGALDADLRTDMTVNIDKTTVRADNLRASVGDSHLTGSVEVSGLQDPAIRIDLEADTIDADRYLLPVTASGAPSRATPLGVSIEALRALDLSGELRVGTLTFQGVRMQDVRLTAGGAASGG
jgi:AsmA family